MKVEVTHLKAPWPAGVVVGAIVLLAAPLLPAWAAGKCRPLPDSDDREAQFAWEPPATAEPEFVVNPAAEADRRAAETAALLEEQGQQLQDAHQALATARAEIQSLGAQLAEAHGGVESAKAQADVAQADASRSAADLVAVTQQRDAALAELQALREGLPAVTGDTTGEALPPIDEAKAPAATRAKKAPAA